MEVSIYNVVKRQLEVLGINEKEVWTYIKNKARNQTMLSMYI